MRGVIIKPTQCCGNATSIGKVVTVVEKTPIGKLIHCPFCDTFSKNEGQFVRTDIKSKAYKYISIHESRIKFFDQTLDKEIETEFNEDIVKEKETV